MLTFVIVSTLFFFGIPLFLVLSILKSEEKLIDASIQRLGGQKAVRAANKAKGKNKKVTNNQLKPKPQPVKGKIKDKTTATVITAKKMENSDVKDKSSTTKVKVPPMKASHLNSRLIIFQQHFMEELVHLKDWTASVMLTLRKKMPGYIYPSRSEMVRDQLLLEEKRKQKLMMKS